MRRRWLMGGGVALVALLVLIVALVLNAPGASRVALGTPEAERVVFPAVEADNLNGETLRFPAAFASHAHNLVVMPFDREQQERALSWLEPFQAEAEARPDVNYYSIAALPDQAPAVRGLIVGGLNVGVRDPAVRARTLVLFLEEQAAWLDALEIDDGSRLAVLLVDEAGVIHWRTAGPYDASRAEALRAALAAP